MSKQTSSSTFRTVLTRYKDLNANQYSEGSLEIAIHHQMHMLVIVKDQKILQQVSLLNPGPRAYFFKKQIYFESRSANTNYRFRITLFDESSVTMLCAELGRYIKVEPENSGYETLNEQSRSAELQTVKDEAFPLQLKSQTKIEKGNVPLNQPRNEVDASRAKKRTPNDVGRVSDAFKRWKTDSPREYQLAMISCGMVLRSFPSFCLLEEELGESLFPTNDQREDAVPVRVSLSSTQDFESQSENIQKQNSELDVTITVDQESDEQDPFNETLETIYSSSSADFNLFGD